MIREWIVTLEITVEAVDRTDALDKAERLLADTPGVLFYDAEISEDDLGSDEPGWMDNINPPGCEPDVP